MPQLPQGMPVPIRLGSYHHPGPTWQNRSDGTIFSEGAHTFILRSE